LKSITGFGIPSNSGSINPIRQNNGMKSIPDFFFTSHQIEGTNGSVWNFPISDEEFLYPNNAVGHHNPIDVPLSFYKEKNPVFDMHQNPEYYRDMINTVNRKLRQLYDRGIKYRNELEYNKSIKEFEDIITIAPQNITGYNSRGYTYLACNELELALKDFNKCAQLDPKNYTVLLNRGKTLIHLDRIKDALANYNRLILIDRKDGRGWNGRGVCLKKLGYAEKSIECFDYALKLTPQFHKEPLTNRGFTLWAQEKFLPAILDFSELIKRYGPTYEERQRPGMFHVNIFMSMRERSVQDLKAQIFMDKKYGPDSYKEVFWNG